MEKRLKRNKLVPKDELIKKAWWWSLSLVGVNLILTGVFFWQLPKEIPLFYSQPEGRAQLADKWWVWLLPGLAIGFWLIINLLIKLIDEEMKVLTRLMAGFLVLISLLLAISLAHILLIVL